MCFQKCIVGSKLTKDSLVYSGVSEYGFDGSSDDLQGSMGDLDFRHRRADEQGKYKRSSGTWNFNYQGKPGFILLNF